MRFFIIILIADRILFVVDLDSIAVKFLRPRDFSFPRFSKLSFLFFEASIAFLTCISKGVSYCARSKTNSRKLPWLMVLSSNV